MEEMKVEEETVVTEQVGQGVINTPIKQENGVVQKESMQTEAPPLRHQTGPEGPSNPVATPEKPTPKVAKARSPPPSREVPDTLRDFTSPVDRPAPGAAREKGNSPGFSPDPEVTSPPEVAACGSLNTEGSLPRPLLATPSR
ncbi:hypothetical protein NHX12_021357 [Muraenolepis orangiensis]|uniref:Uncharacterized protein n=1 Tax=Muraenolepis orangiensis TaxID=630683 RepID=A0A9Q0ESW5_9TELE|nr:hypothetical protein NHX12_021357 [Muraenolepis orangiensis]